MEIKKEESNIDILKRNFRQAFNALSVVSYGSKLVLVDGKAVKINRDFYTDYDEIFDHGQLVRFLDHGVAREKDWIMVRGDDVVEYGMKAPSSVAAWYPGLVRDNDAKLYKVLFDFKKDFDNQYQIWSYATSLTESKIVRHGDKVVVNQKLKLKDINKRKEKIASGCSSEVVKQVRGVMDKTLIGYTDIVIKGALFRKFIGDLKLALWHFVDERDSGKTTWLDMINENIEIYQEDNLQKIFGDRAKVNVSELSRAILLHQDETTVMFNDFKLLTNSTLKLSLAYAKKQTTIVAPLVIMTSHDDAMDTYSEQFQARVVKVYPKVGDIKERLTELESGGISMQEIAAISYIYVREIIERNIALAVSDPSKVEHDVLEFVSANKVQSHDPVELVRSEIYNLISKVYRDRDMTGTFDTKVLDRYGIELGQRNSKDIIVVTGMMKMKREFLSNLVHDKTIYYEVVGDKKKYAAIGFDFFKTFSFDDGSRRQDAWVLNVDDLLEDNRKDNKKSIVKSITEFPAPPIL